MVRNFFLHRESFTGVTGCHECLGKWLPPTSWDHGQCLNLAGKNCIVRAQSFSTTSLAMQVVSVDAIQGKRSTLLVGC